MAIHLIKDELIGMKYFPMNIETELNRSDAILLEPFKTGNIHSNREIMLHCFIKFVKQKLHGEKNGHTVRNMKCYYELTSKVFARVHFCEREEKN